MNSLKSLEDLLDAMENQGATKQQLLEFAQSELKKLLPADGQPRATPEPAVYREKRAATSFAKTSEVVHS